MKTIKFHTTWGVLGSVVLLSACTMMTPPSSECCAPASHARDAVPVVVPATGASATPNPTQNTVSVVNHIARDPKLVTDNGPQLKTKVTAVPAQPQRITAVGYGAVVRDNAQYNYSQQKLMAVRAAQIDAYRNLAEQVYGFRIWGNTSVAAFAAQNDNIRSFVDGFIRGARVISITPVADGNYEVTVELDLSHTFINRVLEQEVVSAAPAPAPAAAVASGAAAGTQPAAPGAPCAGAGCVQPSIYYYSSAK